MQIPPEITYRNVEKTEAIHSLVLEKIEKLEQVCDRITSCRIAIEKTHVNPDSGSPFRVRIDLTVPPTHELAAENSPNQGKQYEPIDAVIRDTFEAARRQLVELADRKNNNVKEHPQQIAIAIVTKLFPKEGYGFLKATDTGMEVYFHKNSVSNNDFENIEIGTGVQFLAEQGEKGLQATTVRIVNKPGSNISPGQELELERPLGWR